MGERVYTSGDLSVGDAVAYTGNKRVPPVRRDWILVSRIGAGAVFGERMYPLDWERDQEYTIIREQLEANGVLVRNADEVRSDYVSGDSDG